MFAMICGILGLLIFVLDVWAILSVLASNSAIERKILWVLVILMLPVIGLLLYLLIGRSAAHSSSI